MANGWFREVVTGGDVIRSKVLHYFKKHGGESIERAGWLAVWSLKIRECMVRTMNNRVRIKKYESFPFLSHILVCVRSQILP